MSTSLQAPAGATECLNPELDSALSVLAACSQHRQAWGLTRAQPRNHMPRYFGEAMLESPGSVCPCGGTQGGGTGQGKFWRGLQGQQLSTGLQQRGGWGGSLPPSPKHLPLVLVLQMQCSYHIYFGNLFNFFFTLLELFFEASTFLLLGQLCKTEGVIKSCRDKQALLLNQKSLFYRFNKQRTADNHSPITFNAPKRWKKPSILYPCTTTRADSAIQQLELPDTWQLLALTASLWEALPWGHSSS